MRIGYAYWGFLADEKYNSKGEVISTPDGNAFYSWSIINSLQEAGHQVWQMMPNRDKPIETLEGKSVIDSFCGMGFENYNARSNPRYNAYMKMKKNMYNYVDDWKSITKERLFDIWNGNNVRDFNAILLEWRMEIPGRNVQNARFENVEWQPDLFIQECIIDYCSKYGVKLVIFDLDYKLTYEQVMELRSKRVDYFIIELGNKWEINHRNIRAIHIEVPFDFRYINNYGIYDTTCDSNLVYVGNRYERDWCIDMYIPTELRGVTIYGNWLEGNRDSHTRWPGIDFRSRISAKDMFDAYNYSTCTILLAKKDYVKYNFMTVRVIESIYYGTLPLFIEEYGYDVIDRYAGEFGNELTVQGKADVIDKVMYYKYHQGEREAIIKYLREHLKFMDSSIFVRTLEEVIMV